MYRYLPAHNSYRIFCHFLRVESSLHHFISFVVMPQVINFLLLVKSFNILRFYPSYQIFNNFKYVSIQIDVKIVVIDLIFNLLCSSFLQFLCTGTPADCTSLGISGALFPDVIPNLVIFVLQSTYFTYITMSMKKSF